MKVEKVTSTISNTRKEFDDVDRKKIKKPTRLRNSLFMELVLTNTIGSQLIKEPKISRNACKHIKREIVRLRS